MDEQEMLDRAYRTSASPAPDRTNTNNVVFIHSSEGYGMRSSDDEPAPTATKVEVTRLNDRVEARIVRRHPKDSAVGDEAFKERAKKVVQEEFRASNKNGR